VTIGHAGGMHYAPGQTLNGRYEILEGLGQGGMSEAYKARDRSSGQLVVLKIPFGSIIGDPATFSRYQRELEIGRRLNHPNIQHLIDQGRIDGGAAPYLVLEYVDGVLLRDYLAERGRLPIEEALDIAVQLVDALQYCHEHGVVHRDLKPENVLIAPDGKVKLVDFGIALLRGARRLTFRRLSSGVGTPDYMAPEQVQGDRGDARTDMYAVGVMLYEMLTGEVPYQGDSPLAVMSQRVTTDAPLLRRALPGVPPALEAVVWRALRRDPAERYQSMEALCRDLKDLDSVVIPTYPEPSRPTLAAWSRQLATAAIVALVLVALVLVGVAAEMLHRLQVAGR
jgi:eukaryotic-like serine/threonine-protein kinase